MNRKPFDLEAAKRGEPVVDIDGFAHRFIAHIPDANIHSRVVTLAHGCIRTWTEDGRPSPSTARMLFMAPKKREGWTFLYRDAAGRPWADKVLASKDDAERYTKLHKNIIAIVRIEWEE